MPFRAGVSGNLRGRPRSGYSLRDMIDAKLDKRRYVDFVCKAATNQIPGMPHLVVASYVRMVWHQLDGLPIRRSETEKEVRVRVNYVQDHPKCINVTPQPSVIEASSERGQEDVHSNERPDDGEDLIGLS